MAEDPQCLPASQAPERLSGREDWPSGRERGGSAQAYRHGYPGLCEADVHHHGELNGSLNGALNGELNEALKGLGATVIATYEIIKGNPGIQRRQAGIIRCRD